MSERLNVRRVGVKNSWKKGDKHPVFGTAWCEDRKGRLVKDDVELHEKPNGWFYVVYYKLKTFKEGNEAFEKRIHSHERLYDNSSTKDVEEVEEIEDGGVKKEKVKPKAAPKKAKKEVSEDKEVKEQPKEETKDKAPKK